MASPSSSATSDVDFPLRFLDLHGSGIGRIFGNSTFNQHINFEMKVYGKCEGGGDVVGVVTPLRGGAQVVLHGIQVV